MQATQISRIAKGGLLFAGLGGMLGSGISLAVANFSQDAEVVDKAEQAGSMLLLIGGLGLGTYLVWKELKMGDFI